MSIAFESPSRRPQASENYFTPLNMPPILPSAEEATSATTGSTTPYFTAPINPMLHQEFLNAIHAHHSGHPTFLDSGVGMDMKPTTPAFESGGKNPMTFSMNASSIANRRLVRTSSRAEQSLVSAMDSNQLQQLLASNDAKVLILDVRSFAQYSHARIRTAINIWVPITILKRSTFTMDKVYEAIVLESDRERLRQWPAMTHIIFCDQSSEILSEQCATTYLSNKFNQAGYKGEMHFLKGGFAAFSTQHPDQCESSPPPTDSRHGGSLPPPAPATSGAVTPMTLAAEQLPSGRQPLNRPFSMKLPAARLGPFTAPMPQFENQAFNPFFSNIRQNLELCHGPMRERFPVRLPLSCSADPQTGRIKASSEYTKQPRCISGVSHIEGDTFVGPKWLRDTILAATGPQTLTEMYERIERTEQRRLQNIMFYHAKHVHSQPGDFPLSIVAGIEMGAHNRYTNIWPFEYTRVKIARPQNQPTDYINASYIQYAHDSPSAEQSSADVSDASLRVMKAPASESTFRRYISTQGPLPATFGDFWQVVWEQNSRVLVMLTKEEEMNKIKCHRYWPSQVNQPTLYGQVTVTLLSETTQPVRRDDEDDKIIIRQLLLQMNGSVRRAVTHIQYTGWLDFGVPDNPLGTLQVVSAADQSQVLYEQQEDQEMAVGPMIVHCSAGCGRSGAFCAIDTVIRRLCAKEGDKDLLLDTISRFREQRVSMVQTLRQFVFCYEAIWWWLLGNGSLPAGATPMDTDS